MADNQRCIVNENLRDVDCQFLVRKNDGRFQERTFEHNGNYYCIFHLPVEAKKDVDDDIAQEELRCLRSGRTKDGSDSWLDYSYVKDDKTYNLDIYHLREGDVLNFTGFVLNADLTLGVQKDVAVNRLELNNVKVSGQVDIDIKNLALLNIEGSHFHGDFELKTLACGEAIIDNSCFYSKFSVKNQAVNTVFDGFIVRNKSSFKQSYFRGLQFNKNCQFVNINFLGICEFDRCAFEDGARFICEFGKSNDDGQFKFLGCMFKDSLDFSGSNFNYDVNFHGLTGRPGCSDAMVMFNNVNSNSRFILDLKDIARIKSIEFNGNKNVHLNSCLFIIGKDLCKKFILKNYIVNGEIKFVPENRHIQDANKLAALDFENTKFKEVALFQDIIFTEKTNFKSCVFCKPPLFHRSELHPDTVFPTKNAFEQREAQDENAYHTLYREAARLQKREYEGIFYALTQKCHRKSLTTKKALRFTEYLNIWATRLFSALYDWLSEYGMNYWRPLWLMLTVVSIYSVVYALILPGISWGSAIDFSLRQVVPYQVLHRKDFTFQQQRCELNSKQSISDNKHDNQLKKIKQNNSQVKKSIPVLKANECGDISLNDWIPASESFLFSVLFVLFTLAIRWNYKRE